MISVRFARYLSLATALFAGSALGALPPAYQRAGELKAAIDAATEVLDGAPIISVEYILEDVYRVYSDDCTVTVLINTIIETKAEPMVRPRKFEAVADEPVCGAE